MKPRAPLYAALNLLVVALLVACATAVETGYSPRPADWLLAHQQTPTLWLVDFAALYIAALGMTAIGDRGRLLRQAGEVQTMRREHQRQLEASIERTEALEETNANLLDRLEANGDAPPAPAAAPAQGAAHAAPPAASLQGQVEAHARQLDAVNLALQYQRSELAQLRRALRAALLPGSDTVTATFLAQDELDAGGGFPARLSAPPEPPEAVAEDAWEGEEPEAAEERFVPRLVTTGGETEDEADAPDEFGEPDEKPDGPEVSPEASANARNAFVLAGGDFDVLRARAAQEDAPAAPHPESGVKAARAAVPGEWRVRL